MAKSKPVETKVSDPETEQVRKSLAVYAKGRKVSILGENSTELLMGLLIELGAKALVTPIRSGVYRGGKEPYGQIVEVRGFSFIVDKTT